MSILEFLKRKEPLGQVYFLVGEDRYQLWLAEQKIIEEAFSPEEERDVIRFAQNPTADELAVALASPGFFSTQTLGIIEDSQWFGSDKKSEERKAEESKIGDILNELPEESRVIIKAVKADKRGSLYKKIVKTGILLEGELLKGQGLKSYVQDCAKELNLQFRPDGFQWLMGQWDLLEGVSVGLIRQELEKMWLYHQGNPLSKEEVESLLSELPEISAFKLLDAWGSGGVEKSLIFLGDLLKNGEAPLKLLGLFTWHVRNLWQVKVLENESKDRIASQVGIRPFQVDRLLRTARSMTKDQAEGLMLGLAEADLALKSGVGVEMVLEKLLLAPNCE